MEFNEENKIFGSINRQFLLYFLLFSYIPLMIFTVFVFFVHKKSITEMYYREAAEVNYIESKAIQRFFEFREKKTNSESGGDIRSNLLRIDKNNSILPDGKEQIFRVNDVSAEIVSRMKKGVTFVVDLPNKVVYVKKEAAEPNNLYFPVSIEDIQRFLKESDRRYHTELIFKQDNGRVIIGANNLFETLNKDSIRYENHIKYISEAGGWELATYYSSAVLERKILDFLIGMFFANLVIGILLFVIAVFLANKIVTPIRMLAQAAEKISRGELCDKPNDNGKNELKTMGDQFDAMRIKLKAAYASLERKIEERTKALQEAQFQVSHQEKMASLGLMAAGVAHEIGNPLTSISSLTQIIKRKIDDPQQIKYADTILENIERISKIVHELVDFARPASYRALMTDINEIIRNAVNIVQYDRRAKKVEFELDLQKDLPPIQLVSDQLLQVFINILINAVDALGEKDNLVSVRSYSESEKVFIVFKDTGEGIAAEDIDKIFQPFFTTKDVGKGTGLGLSVSYGIIKNLNGSIEVKSELGAGSEFIVQIPIEQDNEKNGD